MAAVDSPFWDLCPGVSVGAVGIPLRHGGSKLSDIPSYLRGLVEEESRVWCVRACVFACTCMCGHLCEVVSRPL